MLLDLAQRGLNTVLIIDEAQNLPNDTLEELRLLSNLETEKKKLLQIILVGQIELEQKLKAPELRQLDQRITIRYRLKPLSRTDTIAYINHRLSIAGGKDTAQFSPRVLKEVYRVSSGIPRLINIICERALMAAFVDGKSTIERAHLKKAMDSITGEKLPQGSRNPGAGHWHGHADPSEPAADRGSDRRRLSDFLRAGRSTTFAPGRSAASHRGARGGQRTAAGPGC